MDCPNCGSAMREFPGSWACPRCNTNLLKSADQRADGTHDVAAASAAAAGSLVDELRQRLAVVGVGSPSTGTMLFRFADVAEIATRHEARWQAERQELADQAEFWQVQAEGLGIVMEKERQAHARLVEGLRAFITETEKARCVYDEGGMIECRQVCDLVLRKLQALLAAAHTTTTTPTPQTASDAEQQAIGSLLAVIFRDGGHREAEIGDLVKACEEAQSVVVRMRSNDPEELLRREGL